MTAKEIFDSIGFFLCFVGGSVMGSNVAAIISLTKRYGIKAALEFYVFFACGLVMFAGGASLCFSKVAVPLYGLLAAGVSYMGVTYATRRWA